MADLSRIATYAADVMDEIERDIRDTEQDMPESAEVGHIGVVAEIFWTDEQGRFQSRLYGFSNVARPWVGEKLFEEGALILANGRRRRYT